jgi:alpha-1,3-glucan synthase
MVGFRIVTALLGLVVTTCSWPFDPEQVGYNLNENQNATTPLEYWGEWSNHGKFPNQL